MDANAHKFYSLCFFSVWMTSYCCLPSLLTMEPSHDSSIWHHSSGVQAPTWWQVDYNGHYQSWKKQWFILIRIESYPGYRFSFPVRNSSASTTTRELTECLICRYGILYIMAEAQGVHFMSKYEWQWVNNGIFNICTYVPFVLRDSQSNIMMEWTVQHFVKFTAPREHPAVLQPSHLEYEIYTKSESDTWCPQWVGCVDPWNEGQ